MMGIKFCDGIATGMIYQFIHVRCHTLLQILVTVSCNVERRGLGKGGFYCVVLSLKMKFRLCVKTQNILELQRW